MKNTTRVRFPMIDDLYTYGMLLVVLGHIRLDDTFGETLLFRWIYGFHMPLFFWIAGFLFSKTKADLNISFLKKKAKKLLIPVVVLTSLVFFPKVLLSQYALRPQEGGLSGFLTCLVYPDDNPIQLLWFLYVLFEIYIVGFICRRLTDKTCAWVAVGAVSMVLGYIYMDIKLLSISVMLYELPYFCAGVLTRRYLSATERFTSSHISGHPITLWVVSTIVYTILLELTADRYILGVTGILAAICFLYAIRRSGISFFPWLRPYTFTIYLLQWFPMVAARIGFFSILHWNIYVCYIIMFLVGVFIPVLIGRLVQRYLPANAFGNFIMTTIGMTATEISSKKNV